MIRVLYERLRTDQRADITKSEVNSSQFTSNYTVIRLIMTYFSTFFLQTIFHYLLRRNLTEIYREYL